MPTAADLTAGQVMNGSASLLNDTLKSVYTFAAQLPYLRIALQELREWFELHNIAVQEAVSAVIQVDAGVTEIIYQTTPPTPGVPVLPDDFVEPVQVWERLRDTDPWTPMRRREFIPHYLEGEEISNFLIYVWQEQKIKVLPANQDNDIKIDYIKQLFTTVTDENTAINVVNAVSYLEYRTAALCAEFIERNLASAQGLNVYAELAKDRVTGISSKSKQAINTRRRPFRSGYKRRSPFM